MKIHPLFNSILNNNFILSIISLLLGVAVFDYYFDFTIINPSNTSWIMRLQGDHSQHYLGSIAFRADEWHFPFTKTTYINYPEGVSIIYTDSNPLLAVIAKIFRFIFLPAYQYTGIWYLLCFSLQSFLGYVLIKKITNNTLFALIAGLLFCLLPAQINRSGHENLMAFWLIIWGLYVYINPDITYNKKSLLFFIILTISSLTHAYLCIMILFISGTWYVKEAIDLFKGNKKPFYLFVIHNALYGLSFVCILWAFGYFYNTPANTGLMGFGLFSMNLVAPLNPMGNEYSTFLNGTTIKDGQYEGFQYWGLGIILLFLFTALSQLKKIRSSHPNILLFLVSISAAILLLKNQELSFYERTLVTIVFLLYSILLHSMYELKDKNILILFIPASLCFILALSNIITLGNSVLFEYPLNDGDFFCGFFRTIRSSGRLFWVTTHVLIIAALFILHKTTSFKSSIYIIALFTFIQVIDLHKIHYIIDSNDPTYESSLSTDSKNAVLACHNVKFIGAIHMPVADFALLNNKPINQFYTAHNSGRKTVEKITKERELFEKNIINPEELLLFGINDLPLNKEIIAEPFDENFLTSTTLIDGQLQKSQNAIIKKAYPSIKELFLLIQSNNFVIIAAKDEAAQLLDQRFTNQLDETYGTTLSKLQYRQSYFAIFHNGKLISEKIGVDNFVEFNETIETERIYIKSAGHEFGNIAQLKFNGFDYSPNLRGLNIVTLKINANKSRSVSLINYDTCEHSYFE
jgi:hypothetical protein